MFHDSGTSTRFEHWHLPTGLVSTFSDKDYLLGLNAAQTTLAAIARLAGADKKMIAICKNM